MTSVDSAIKFLAQNETPLEDKEAIQFLVKKGINNEEAIEIVTFLPIAFVRSWLTTLNWKDNYIEYQNGKYIEKNLVKQNHIFKFWK